MGVHAFVMARLPSWAATPLALMQFRRVHDADSQACKPFDWLWYARTDAVIAQFQKWAKFDVTAKVQAIAAELEAGALALAGQAGFDDEDSILTAVIADVDARVWRREGDLRNLMSATQKHPLTLLAVRWMAKADTQPPPTATRLAMLKLAGELAERVAVDDSNLAILVAAGAKASAKANREAGELRRSLRTRLNALPGPSST